MISVICLSLSLIILILFSYSAKTKKNKSKSKKAELNRKGEEKSSLGSDMDAFKDLNSAAETKKPKSAPTQSKSNVPPAKPTDNSK